MSFVVSTLVLYLFLLINICHCLGLVILAQGMRAAPDLVSEGNYEALMEIAAFGAATLSVLRA